jgi:glucose-1-phosphate thymidylyltransferase
MKGIILAGGMGARLHPITNACSKQLLPIYDKPLIYYPLCTLMNMGIKEILCITRADNLDAFSNLLGDGSQWGINIQYTIQDKPMGIAEAFIIGERFIGEDSVTLILGDNIFYGSSITEGSQQDDTFLAGARIFAYQVPDPERYGVVDFSKDGKALSIQEKPLKPKSNYAVTGLYVYNNSVIEKAKSLQPSARGELEISDINQSFLEESKLEVSILDEGSTWFDAGTPDSLMQASQFVQSIQKRQSTMIGSPEETAFKNKLINEEEFLKIVNGYSESNYRDRLREVRNPS